MEGVTSVGVEAFLGRPIHSQTLSDNSQPKRPPMNGDKKMLLILKEIFLWKKGFVKFSAVKIHGHLGALPGLLMPPHGNLGQVMSNSQSRARARSAR